MADEVTTTPAPAATEAPSPAPVAESAPAPAAEPKAPRTARAKKAATADAPKGETVELTAAQAEGKAFTDKTSREIDDLWAKAEGRAPKAETPAEDADEPTAEAKADKPAEQKASEPTPDEIREQARAEERARIDREAKQKDDEARRLKAAQDYQQRVSQYVGSDTDMQSVVSALEAAHLGNFAPLDALDVVLPNGKRVSEIKGDKGLTAEEAQNLVYTWRQARELGDHVGDRKVQSVLNLWNTEVTAALDHPDVDAASVTQHQTPGEQMRALRESVTQRVTDRLTKAHQAEIATKDAEITRLQTRVDSLVNERGNLRSEALAADAPEIARTGQGSAVPRGLPSPDDLHRMSTDDAFKKGGPIDQLWSIIEGGRPRRRTG